MEKPADQGLSGRESSISWRPSKVWNWVWVVVSCGRLYFPKGKFPLFLKPSPFLQPRAALHPYPAFPFRTPRGCLMLARPAHLLLQDEVSYLDSDRCSPYLKGPHSRKTCREHFSHIPETPTTELTCLKP